jgi:peptidyl-prolyl cis-trans isomerase A (cyclophilin A)
MSRKILVSVVLPLLFAAQCQADESTSPATGNDSASHEVSATMNESQSEANVSQPNPALRQPSLANEEAPESYRAKFRTTKGEFIVEVNKAWAPLGADRFYNLVKIGFFKDAAFFRVLDGFVVQFGINADPEVNRLWRQARVSDDPVKRPNRAGTITFATSGPDSRTTQLFINLNDNTSLDRMGFAPFGRVIVGTEVVESLYGGYGEGAPRGRGPDQGLIQTQGNSYLKEKFPKLDYIITATIEE